MTDHHNKTEITASAHDQSKQTVVGEMHVGEANFDGDKIIIRPLA